MRKGEKSGRYYVLKIVFFVRYNARPHGVTLKDPPDVFATLEDFVKVKKTRLGEKKFHVKKRRIVLDFKLHLLHMSGNSS